MCDSKGTGEQDPHISVEEKSGTTKVQGCGELRSRRGTKGTLTHVILQAKLKFGPEHDEGEGSIKVDIVCVVHAVFLAWRNEGDNTLPGFLLLLHTALPSHTSRIGV